MEDVGEMSNNVSGYTPMNKSEYSNDFEDPYRGKSKLSQQPSIDSTSKQKRSLSTLPKSTTSPYQ